jgi:hypothetical protein
LQRGALPRTAFNDLARAAHVETLVTKTISGHVTDRMREHYSTMQPVEQRESIGRMLRLVKGGAVTSDAAESGAPSGASGRGGHRLTRRIPCRRERFRTLAGGIS